MSPRGDHPAHLSLMTPPASVLHDWWRQLATTQPRRVWFGSFLWHDLEALVDVAIETALDPLQRAVLLAVAADIPSPLAFDPQVDARVRHELAADGLLINEEGRWSPTPLGRDAAVAGAFTQTMAKRQRFAFIDNTTINQPPAFFVPRKNLASVPPPPAWTFAPEVLAECIQRPQEWKTRRAFPSEVRSLRRFDASTADWRAVMIDVCREFVGVLVESSQNAAVTGFTLRPGDWQLELQQPAFVLASWEEALADLTVELPAEMVRGHWLSWCDAHGIKDGEIPECALELAGHRLIVRAPPEHADRLRRLQGNPLQSDSWLMIGTGRFRLVAQLDVMLNS